MKDYRVKELSWLSFNARLLQEAQDLQVPLFDRIKFLGIYSSNLDEFFEVRIATLKRLSTLGKKAIEIIKFDPKKILPELEQIIRSQQIDFNTCYNRIIEELKENHIHIINEKEVNQNQSAFLLDYFIREVRHRIFPIIISSNSPVPVLKDKAIYLLVRLRSKNDKKKEKYSIIHIPSDVLPRFVELPSDNHERYIIFLDDIIRFGLDKIFYMFGYPDIEAYDIKITRDAELDIEDDFSTSIYAKISESLRKRESGIPVRIGFDSSIPSEMLSFILKKMKIKKTATLIPGGRYHNSRDFINFPNLFNRPASKIGDRQPIKRIDPGKGMMTIVEKKDKLLHFPYQSFSTIIDILREASIDPAVQSIKITLYRLAKNSNVINALINAKKNGKKVTVVIEIQARFDEESNIHWANVLKQEGIKVIPGIPGLKIHSKICLITKKCQGKNLKKICLIGTGNFNEFTANIYTDHYLITSKKDICDEVDLVFDFLDKPFKNIDCKKLLVSPFNMKKNIMKLIDAEANAAKRGLPSGIKIKVNNLTDPDVINHLYLANKAGVKTQLLVRGMFSLIPGVPGLSENIVAKGIVDKYLEHSRVFIFQNKGDEICYISSADLMTRNLENRIEIASPIVSKELVKELVDIFDLSWKDNVKARLLDKNLLNNYYRNDKESCRSQIEIQKYLNRN